MKRLTQRDGKGNWSVAGVEWGNVKGNLYGALCKLKDYEDAEESGQMRVMDCTGCIHKGNKQFCLNCKRGGCRDYYLVEESNFKEV